MFQAACLPSVQTRNIFKLLHCQQMTFSHASAFYHYLIIFCLDYAKNTNNANTALNNENIILNVILGIVF